MNKVDELVESRAMILAQEDNCFWDDLPEEPTITCMHHCKWRYRRIAKHILSHSNLALRVDGIRECAGEDGSPREYVVDEYVPLAEALRQEGVK